jgi:hypothetical protein
MADHFDHIVAPIPVYHADRELLARLAKELQEERDKNFNLARDLAIEKHKTQQLECYLLSVTNLKDKKIPSEPIIEDKKRMPKTESMDTLASASDLTESITQIGVYSSETRRFKIMKYKEKIKKYRQKVHVSRNFSGRSIVAKIKPRINGKFVKSTSIEALKI